MTVDDESNFGVTSRARLAQEATTDEAPRRGPGGKGSPLSWFQERLWVHHQREPDNTSYNLPLLLLIRGELDVSALERGLSEIVARHEILRTHYGQSDTGEPLQFVAPPEHVRLPVLAVDRAQMLQQLERHLEHRFDLRRGPVFIASLLRVSADRHLLLFNVHHIAADGWSLTTAFLAELQGAYAAFARGEQSSLPTLAIQYKDFAAAQRTSEMSAQLAFWRRTLDGYEDSLELPSAYTRQVKSGTQSASFVYRYSPEFAKNLEQFSRQQGCTLFMSLLAALGVTLSRYANKDDLCIGTTTSERTDVQLESLIGFFVNILPLRLRIDEQSSVSELLKAVRAQVLAAFDHAVPFERILRETEVARRGSANPLVPVVMRHQNFPRASLDVALPGAVSFGSYPEPNERDEAVRNLLAREQVPARCEIELSYCGDADEVMYTSGSTGTPKGVRVPHRQLVNWLDALETRLPFAPGEVVGQIIGRSSSTSGPIWSRRSPKNSRRCSTRAKQLPRRCSAARAAASWRSRAACRSAATRDSWRRARPKPLSMRSCARWPPSSVQAAFASTRLRPASR